MTLRTLQNQVEALERMMVELSERVAALESRRGPGRPPRRKSESGRATPVDSGLGLASEDAE